MLLIIKLLKSYKATTLFLLLEVLTLSLYYRSDGYGPEVFRNIGFQIQSFRFALQSYFSLAETNAKLLAENTHLRKQLYELLSWPHNLQHHSYDTLISVKITHSTHLKRHNFLTLNKGRTHGVSEDMGVIGPKGVVGRVRYVSENYALAHSLLDVDLLTSARIRGVLCTIRWHGKHLQRASLEYLPRHVTIAVNDTIYTSGYDPAYPAHTHLLLRLEASLSKRMKTFYKAEVNLLTDFSGTSVCLYY